VTSRYRSPRAGCRTYARRPFAAGALAIALSSSVGRAAPSSPKRPPAAEHGAGDSTDEAGPEGEGKREARQLARQALELMHAGRWNEAEELLAKAYALVPAPTVAVLDARALEKLGKLVEAESRYAEAQKPEQGEVSGAFREAAEDAARRLERLRPRIPTIRVGIAGVDPSNVVASLDGKALSPADLALPIAVDPGVHVIVATSPDGAHAEDRLNVEEGESKDVSLDLAAPAPPAPVSPSPAEPPPPPPSHATRTWGFISLAVGTAGVATGITAGLVMLGAKSDLDRACTPECPPGSASELSRFRTSRIVSMVGYGVGAAGVGTGVVLLLLSPRHDPVRAQAGAGVVAGIGSVAVEGSF